MAAALDHGGGDSAIKQSTATLLNDDELTKPIFENGCYRNPWKTWKEISVANLMHFVVKTKNESNVPSKEVTICEQCVCLA